MADAETLFAEHQPGVLRYLTRAVGHRDTARDLTQEVLGGFQAGFARGSRAPVQAAPVSVATESAPPTPTVVIKLDPGTTWEEPAKGGRP